MLTEIPDEPVAILHHSGSSDSKLDSHYLEIPMGNPLSYTQSLLNSIQKQDYQIARKQHLRDNPVYPVMDAVKNYVEAFEQSLDEEHEIGVRLLSYGSDVIFHAEYIGFTPPHVITFSGVTSEGERVQLVQHVSQLSFLLKAVPKLDQKARRIGFNAQEETS